MATTSRCCHLAARSTGPRFGGALLCSLLLLVAAPAAGLPSSWDNENDEGLIRALQEGGLVVYVRHGAAETGDDDVTRLTEDGCAQITAAGAALADAGIDAEAVLSSPTTRTRQTASRLFPENEVTEEPTLHMEQFGDPETRDTFIEGLRTLLATPTDGGNRWLIGHITPLIMVLDTHFGADELPVGTMVAFLPQGDGRFTHVGNLRPDWGVSHLGELIDCENAPQ